MKNFVDNVGLTQLPTLPNGVQWSEEGLIAVAGGNAVSLLHPGDLGGPRGFVGLPDTCSVAVIDAPGGPRNVCEVHFEVRSAWAGGAGGRRVAGLAPSASATFSRGRCRLAALPVGDPQQGSQAPVPRPRPVAQRCLHSLTPSLALAPAPPPSGS